MSQPGPCECAGQPWECPWCRIPPQAAPGPEKSLLAAPRPSDRLQQLQRALSAVLLSADCAWEEQGLGHDWAEAVEQARTLLRLL